MLTIHLDAVGGISGDMFVAAMLDARPDLREHVLAEAACVLPDGIGPPVLSEGTSGVLRALRFGLRGAPVQPHGHDHATHGTHHHHSGDSSGSFAGMVARIRAAPLARSTVDHAVAILTILAEAEAAIHRVPLADVHFHEIADWDSLLDVTAAGSIAAALEGARWSVSSLPRGGGFVETRHGLLPVPAPATVSILTGFAWRDDGVDGERVTPTGAAIVRHLASEFRADVAPGRLEAVGTGAGTRSLPGISNVLRALVFAAEEQPARDRVSVLSFEIDDMSGEEIAVAAERLRAVTGVLDVSIGSRSGKKGRPVAAFRLLVLPESAEAAIERCFLETSTIGLRIRDESRVVLTRALVRSTSENQEIGVKTVRRPGASTTAKAESDDLVGDSLEARRHLKHCAEQAASE